MLEKITSAGHKCFKDLKWNDLPPFARFNLLYGWNGSGKTTLSCLLARIEQAQPVIDGHVSFTISGQHVRGDALGTIPVPVVRVFNRDYVEKSVLNRSNRLEHIYFLGEKAVAKEKERADVASELQRVQDDWNKASNRKGSASQDYDKFIREKAAAIKQLLRGPGRNRFANYDKGDFEARCLHLGKAETPPTALDETTRDTLLKTSQADIRQRIEPPRIVEPLPEAWTQELRQGFAARPAVTAIDSLKTDPELSAWLGTGVALHRLRSSSMCLYCEQPLGADRIDRLEGHFSDAYRNAARSVSKVLEEVISLLGRVSGVLSPEPGLTYPHLLEQLRAANDTVRGHKSNLVAQLEGLRDALQRRLQNGLDEVEVPVELEDLIPEVDALGRAMLKVNEVLDENNRVTENFQMEVGTARDKLEQDEVVRGLAEFNGRKTSIGERTTAVNDLHKQQEELKRRLAQLETEITETIEPANQLNADLAAYLGHAELTLSHHGGGYGITRAGQPAVDLSEGEKTGLALLYFLKSLEDHRRPLKEAIIVVDDPVSSLDAGALYAAFGFLKERTERAKQLFILTHDFSLFQLTKGWFRHAKDEAGAKVPVSMYQLKARIVGGVKQSVIVKLDRLLSEFDTEYQYLFHLVHEGAHSKTNNLEDLYGLPNVARRLLEHFLAFRFPAGKNSEKLLERMKDLALDANATAVINRFLNINSHGDGVAPAEHDLHLLSEAPRVLTTVLEVMRAEDPSHVKRMEELVA